VVVRGSGRLSVAGRGELLDQGPECGNVLGLQESLEPEPPVAAVPEPEFSRSRGGFLVVAGLRTVLIEVRHDVPPDLV
jgi:hypothetical protein